MKYSDITNHLSFRIIAPVFLLILLAGFSLYGFFYYIASDFINRAITTNLHERASDIYIIVDSSLDELIKSGLSGNERAVRVKKALTVSMIENALQQHNLKGVVTEKDNTVFLADELSSKIIAAADTLKENDVLYVKYKGNMYYLYLFEFEPWGWRIYLIKDEAEYAALINKVRYAYVITGILLLIASSLSIYYLGKTIRYPLNKIIECFKRGEKPEYKGIYEFEFLSDNIGMTLESLKNETQKLNNIYYIAISKRGKEFFNEVTATIARMFNLNSSIAKIEPGRKTVHFVSMYLDGKLKEDIEIPLQNAPCESIMNKQQLVVIEKGACQQFPLAEFMSESQTESYAGVPVFGRNNNVIGIVSAFGKPREFTDDDIKTLLAIGQMVAAEFELIEKTVYLDNIMHSSTDTAIVATDFDLHITYYNSAAEKILGFKPEEAIGQKITEIQCDLENVKPDDFNNAVELAKEKGEHQFFYEKNTQDGIHYVDSRIYTMVDKDNKSVGFVLMARDITDYKRLEEQLLHSQKLEAVGLLAGGVAHEFNNILMAIMGYSSFLKEKIGENDPYKTYLENILVSCEKAANLTKGLLTFSRKQIINPKNININSIIRRVEKLLVDVIGEDIKLRTVLSDTEMTVKADSGQIEQVLMNLVTNARDAMPKGGSLTIKTEAIMISTDYIRGRLDLRPGMYALISVTDTGIGMDEKTIEHIFEPFFTLKEVGKGTGLGLPIVFGIIKQHNGDINVYSELGKGSVFRIYLPLSSGPQTDENQPVFQEPLKGGSETILIVEDDNNIRDLIKDILNKFGYNAIASTDEDAIKIFEDNKEKIQLLILDVIMPKKSGKEIYEEIRKFKPAMKALFMSGYTSDIIFERGILEEGIEFIPKPIMPLELLRKVREVLDK
jgi:PAS domain S-box-containing protein